MKTVIGINNLIAIDQYAYANHVQFFYRLGKHWKNDEFVFVNPRRMTIDRMRNEAAKIALDCEADYLMFIDDDVLVHPRAFDMLQKHDKDIIAGVTHIRGYPFHPMIFNFTDEDYKHNSYVDDYKAKADPETGLLKCDAVGFSCCLIKTSLLKKVIPPYFITSHNQTEDVFFCKRAKEQVPELEIFVDINCETAHLLGSEIIDPGSVELWKEFEEKRAPWIKKDEKKEAEKRGDRDPEHVKQLLDIIKNSEVVPA